MFVRRERFGNLIWSDKDKAYFIANNKGIDKQVDRIIQGIKKDLDVLEELKKMGLRENEKVREIYSDNVNISAPLEYYFDFTDACNLHCEHCYNRERLNSNTMEEDQIEYIIKDMYKNGIMRLHLAGGEPTLFPDRLEKYMKEAKKYGIITSMSSNGTRITDEIGKILIDNDVTSFTVSIESANEKKNTEIRGKNVLVKAIDGIRKIIEYRSKNNGNFMVAIKMSYDTDIELKEFEDMIKLAIDLKIDVLKLINPERCIFHEQHYYSQVAPKYFEIQEHIRNLKEQYIDRINITMVNSPVNLYCNSGLPNMKGCIGAQELIAINPDGSVTPCLMNKYYLGNIFELGGIKNIYLNEKIQKYRNKITNYNCNGCKYHSQCRGGCQVRKIVEYGNIENIDPLCPIKYGCKTEEVNEEKQKYKYFKKITLYHSL